jgi:1,4-dihydroxy-2-naphthoate polyprenyltransferase
LNRQKLILILRLGRLHYLLYGFLFYLVGVLLAVVLKAPFSLDKFLLGYAVFLPAHLAVNYSNEYFDVQVDKFSNPNLFSGGSGVLIKNPELINFAKYFSIFMILLSLTLGTIFTFIYNSTIFLLITIMGNLLAWFYVAPPLKLAYRGLGEIATALTGFLIPGLGYVAIKGSMDIRFLIFSIPLMLFMLFFIISVEVPDLEADKKGGKKTFIVRYGRKYGFWIIFISSSLATVFFLSFPNNLYYPINFNIIAILSLIPTFCSILALLKRNYSRGDIISIVSRNVSSLILFISLVDIYFLAIILGSGF